VSGPGHLTFVVDRVALGQVFSEYFCFPCHSFHRLFYTHDHHPRLVHWTNIVAAVPSGLNLSLSPLYLCIYIYIYIYIFADKVILLTDSGGLLGCQMLKIPYGLENRLTAGGEFVILKHRLRSTPQKHSLILYIYVRLLGCRPRGLWFYSRRCQFF
jgi:hypothetical protein